MFLPSAVGRVRTALTALVVLTAVALVAGCGGSAAPGASTTDASSSAAASGEAFPVAIDHVYGTTTIDAEPQRVVTLGWGSQDAVAALGVVPVGVTDFTWGTVDTYLPWFADKVTELGGQMPEVVEALDSGEYDYEQILGLEPDVIIARHSGITQAQYTRLSEIAPTIAYRSEAWAADWQDVQLTVGEALGRRQAAQEVIDETNATIAAHAAAHPEFQGKTFAYGSPWTEGEAVMGLYGVDDARVKLIEQLGFTPAPAVVERSKATKDAGFEVSLEELDTVDTDVLLIWANDQAQWEGMKAQPLLGAWAPIAQGRTYAMPEQGLAWASSAPSALAIPWSLDTVVPALAVIVAKG
ncbi:iron complex transport system substrate-binding protein [Quadrisphaera granulorum]|uniref:Iron complex transport system substrate-binding protein n=1 Tax=Quadrisphaera granulorum TaxID=317664 RepID=A0A315ZSL0_9ACTN|nr:iron-siderophore ABC transporter substrate-binding protein [Quadrisphaera granulorum]PWJ47714.1 iron complex transport system substrate-binding protein [Quadrisphaera granulorum]SZE98668.1 iron complex transport system substrate-binding protein [Quadrisphaera granulorum]